VGVRTLHVHKIDRAFAYHPVGDIDVAATRKADSRHPDKRCPLATTKSSSTAANGEHHAVFLVHAVTVLAALAPTTGKLLRGRRWRLWRRAHRSALLRRRTRKRGLFSLARIDLRVKPLVWSSYNEEVRLSPLRRL
jgi:hypothetical protein